MYIQIKITEEDQQYHHVLWRDTVELKMKMKLVLEGIQVVNLKSFVDVDT